MSPLAEIQYISTYEVRPQITNQEPQKIDLTPWDLNLLPVQYIQKGLLFHKPESHQTKDHENILIDQLKVSLSRTLDFFFPFAGRLATTTHRDNTTSFYIDCNDSGAELVHATADILVSDILDPLYVPRVVYDFFPIKHAINHDGLILPLLSIQVTFLTDGIFIGCSMNHTVCDGSSFWHFMNSWSEITRGSEKIERLPIFKRWFLNEIDCPIRFPSSNEDQFVERYTPPPVDERMFHFTQQDMAKLKAKANKEMEMEMTQISSLQALLAHVWVAVTRARKLGHEEQVRYRLAVGNRGRINPPLPNDYFGNSVEILTVTAKVGELLEKGFGWAAWLINQAITSQNDSAIRSSLEAWMKKPVLLSRSRVIPNKLITGSSPRFNMYGNDFGWGRPIAVRSGCGNKSDGKITVYPGAASGSVEIEASLSPETLKAMCEDLEFMGSFAKQNV